jgi:hypothetical protein
MDVKDAIKISYAWLGPRGPIWNTELPNILTFCNSAEGGQTFSTNFWVDDVWMRLFRYKKEEYLLYPSVELTDKDIFIYPFSLTWRVSFNHYFFGRTGILEYGHVSQHVVHHVRVNKGFFLIDLAVEAFVQPDQIASMHAYFSGTHRIPMNKIIYLTGCMNANQLYDEWCASKGITDPRDKMNIISFPSSQAVYARQVEHQELKEPEYNTETVPGKLFLSWNRRFRSHRTELLMNLEKLGLVDRSYYSMGLVDPEKPDHMFAQTVDPGTMQFYGISDTDVNRLYTKLPLVIDNETEIVQMCEDRSMLARRYYTNSLISLVTETNYHMNEVTLTEKAFKPAKEKHPFILVGAPGALQSMRDIGYKTFGEFWCEEYDNIKDPRERMREIVRICEDIGKWSPQQIIEFKRKVKPILDHNFSMFNKSPNDLVSTRIHDTVRRIVQ